MNKENKCKELLKKIKQIPDDAIEGAIDSLSEKMNKEETEEVKELLNKCDKCTLKECIRL